MSELQLATQPVLRLPLDGLRHSGSASAVFRVPNTKEWHKLREEWGEPDYIVFAYRTEGRTPFIEPFAALGLAVQASADGQTLPTTPASSPPYSYSSRTTDYGLIFQGRPGAEIRVDVLGENPAALPDGELVIEPLWPGALKDRIVSAMLVESARPYIAGAGVAGLLLVFIALLVSLGRPG